MISDKKSIIMILIVSILLGGTVAQSTEFPYVIERIGEPGTENGEFSGPLSVLRTDNRFYVVDQSNDRVQIFDLNWNYVSEFGGSGTLDGKLDLPKKIISNGTYLFITNTLNSRVEIFDFDGGFIANFGTSGSSYGQFGSVSGIIINDNRIYVADSGNSKIVIFNESNFELIGEISGGGLVSPQDVAVVGEYLFVSDFNQDSIKIFNKFNGIYNGYLGDSGSRIDQLDAPYGLSYVHGYFLITTFVDDGISIFDSAGNFVRKIGGNFNNPTFLYSTEKEVYVPSSYSAEIVTLRMVASPENVEVLPGSDSITVYWDVDSNKGITDPIAYRIYRDDGNGFSFIGEVSDKMFVDQAAMPDTSYNYEVEAVSEIGVSERVSSHDITVGFPQNNTDGDDEDGFFSNLPVPVIPVITVLLLVPILRLKTRS